jgi:predicted transcriptional regulator
MVKAHKETRKRPMPKGNDLARQIPEEQEKKEIARRLAKDPKVIALVKASMKDIEAGEVVSLEEVFPEP